MGGLSSKIRTSVNRYKRRLYESFGNPKYTPKYGLNDLDTKLEKYLNYRRGFFIEVGANDGLKQSNTYYLENGRLWRGILIEALPHLYQACVKNRPRCSVHHCALVSTDYPDDKINIHYIGYSGLMSCVDGAMPLEAIEKLVNTNSPTKSDGRWCTYRAPTTTLESILDQYNAENTQMGKRLSKGIDLLSLDVEGYERNVLEGLNIIKYRPKYILVEARYFEEVNSFLSEHSYSLIEQLTHHDYLYVDNS